MAIYKILNLSTTHLSADTCKDLDAWCRTIDLNRKAFSQSPTLLGATDYGWIIYCTEASVVEEDATLPADMLACMKYAREQGCEFLLFDADAEEIDDLPDLGGPGGHVAETLTESGFPDRFGVGDNLGESPDF